MCEPVCRLDADDIAVFICLSVLLLFLEIVVVFIEHYQEKQYLKENIDQPLNTFVMALIAFAYGFTIQK
jgi:hypothetical protein